VATSLNEVAATASGQRESVDQVAKGVTGLSQTTQDNAASAEELAVTAEQSSGRMARLLQMVETFKVDRSAVARIAEEQAKQES
jgi:methyl-accepting chemotaxis protein